MTHFNKSPLIAAFALLCGCASNYASPVEVTRFVGDQPQLLGSGSIAVSSGAVSSGAGSAAGTLEFAEYNRAIAGKLAELGYTLAAAAPEQTAEVWIDRIIMQPERGRSPVSVGVGGSTGSYGSGLGVGLGIDLSGPPPEQVDSQMRVVIRDTGSNTVLWEGRANFTATLKGEYGTAEASAARLADALFSGFPGNSGETITVK